MHYLNTTKFMKVNNNTHKSMVRAVQILPRGVMRVSE